MFRSVKTKANTRMGDHLVTTSSFSLVEKIAKFYRNLKKPVSVDQFKSNCFYVGTWPLHTGLQEHVTSKH